MLATVLAAMLPAGGGGQVAVRCREWVSLAGGATPSGDDPQPFTTNDTSPKSEIGTRGMESFSGLLGQLGYYLGLIFKGIAYSALALGGGAAFLIGFSKTGIPGAGMPAIALMAEAFPDDTRLSVGAMVPLLILGDIFAVAYYRRHAHWNRLLELVPYVVIGMVPGYFVLNYLDSDWLRTLIGLLILGLLGLHLVRERLSRKKKLPEQWWFVALTGFLAGFGTVVGNAAGPAMAVYLLAKKLDKHEFIGTAAWFFFCVNVSKVPIQWNLGVITPETLKLDLCVAPILVVGALLGVAVHKRISQKAFNTLVLLLAGLFALRLVGVGFSGIFFP